MWYTAWQVVRMGLGGVWRQALGDPCRRRAQRSTREHTVLNRIHFGKKAPMTSTDLDRVMPRWEQGT